MRADCRCCIWAPRASGIGAGAIYATRAGNAVKWIPDRHGLAAGLTAAGSGAGAALTVVPIRPTIAGFGYQSAALWFGLDQGAVLLAVAPLLPGPDQAVAPFAQAAVRGAAQTASNVTSWQMLRSPVFRLMYAMFVAVSASGLMATAQLGRIARDYGPADAGIFLGPSLL